jgi:hypothetical protein
VKISPVRPEEYRYLIEGGGRAGDVDAVAREVLMLHGSLFPEADGAFIQKVFKDVSGLFLARLGVGRSVDEGYHSLTHTLRTTLCLARMLFYRHFLGHEPVLTHEKFVFGITAMMMHDVGFLKDIGDKEGTGAKYSFAQESRSSQFARKYCQELGWSPVDILSLEKIIAATGPRSLLSKFSFLDSSDEILGYCVCSADYLGQMSDPRYVDKLYVLYKELEEADNFRGTPVQKRRYKSPMDLLRKTPGFWMYVLNTKLIKDCKQAYRYLSYPYPDGKNPYLESIQANIYKVRKILDDVYRIHILIGG